MKISNLVNKMREIINHNSNRKFAKCAIKFDPLSFLFEHIIIAKVSIAKIGQKTLAI